METIPDPISMQTYGVYRANIRYMHPEKREKKDRFSESEETLRFRSTSGRLPLGWAYRVTGIFEGEKKGDAGRRHWQTASSLIQYRKGIEEREKGGYVTFLETDSRSR